MLIISLSFFSSDLFFEESRLKSSQRTKSLELTLENNEFSNSRLDVYQTLLMPLVYLLLMLEPPY